MELEIHLGMSEDAGGVYNVGLRGTNQGSKLSGGDFWEEWQDGLVLNESFGTTGFAALPSGRIREENGTLYLANKSTTIASQDNMARTIGYQQTGIWRTEVDPNRGMSVRCIADDTPLLQQELVDRYNERFGSQQSKRSCVAPEGAHGQWKLDQWHDFKLEDLALLFWSAWNHTNAVSTYTYNNALYTYPAYTGWGIMGNEMFLGAYPTEDGIEHRMLTDVKSGFDPLSGYGMVQRLFYNSDTLEPKIFDEEFFQSILQYDDFGCSGLDYVNCLEYPFGGGEHSHLHCTWDGFECSVNPNHQLNHPHLGESVEDSLITNKSVFPSFIMWASGFYKNDNEWVRPDDAPPTRPYFNEFATVNELALHQPFPGDFETWKSMLNKLQPYDGNEDDVWSLPNWEIYDSLGIGIQAHVYTEAGFNLFNTVPSYNFDGYSIYVETL